MPNVDVHGIPRTDQVVLDTLVESLKKAVAEALGLEPDQTSVWLISTMVEKGLGEEIIVFIDGLYAKPERTAEVLEGLCKQIADVIERYARSHVPNCRLIEVGIRGTYDPSDFDIRGTSQSLSKYLDEDEPRFSTGDRVVYSHNGSWHLGTVENANDGIINMCITLDKNPFPEIPQGHIIYAAQSSDLVQPASFI